MNKKTWLYIFTFALTFIILYYFSSQNEKSQEINEEKYTFIESKLNIGDLKELQELKLKAQNTQNNSVMLSAQREVSQNNKENIESKTDSNKSQNLDSKNKIYDITLPKTHTMSSQDSEIKPKIESKNTESKIDPQKIPLLKITQRITQIDSKDSKENQNDLKKPQIIAFFSKECLECGDILPHINALAKTHKNIEFIILNAKDSKIYDATFLNELYFLNLLEVDGALNGLLKGLKRKFNLEIRNYKEPLFLIIQNERINAVIQGIVTQEMLELEIQNLGG